MELNLSDIKMIIYTPLLLPRNFLVVSAKFYSQCTCQSYLEVSSFYLFSCAKNREWVPSFSLKYSRNGREITYTQSTGSLEVWKFPLKTNYLSVSQRMYVYLASWGHDECLFMIPTPGCGFIAPSKVNYCMARNSVRYFFVVEPCSASTGARHETGSPSLESSPAGRWQPMWGRPPGAGTWPQLRGSEWAAYFGMPRFHQKVGQGRTVQASNSKLFRDWGPKR